MPFVTDMQVGPLSFVGTITSAELDVPVDPSLFAVPDVARAGGGRGGRAGTGTGAVPRGRPAKKESHPPGPANRPLPDLPPGTGQGPRAPSRDAVPRKLILCRCEDVTADDVTHAVAAGFRSIEEVKRYTGFGTGPCQGKECLSNVARAIAAMTGRLAGHAAAVHGPRAGLPRRAQVLRRPSRTDDD